MKKTFTCSMLCIAALSFAGMSRAADEFRLTSPDVGPGQPLAERFVLDAFGCKGGNQSPRLRWSGVPAGTKSFVLTVYDPDAPTGSGWWHWVVLDIPADATELPGGVGKGGNLPQGARAGRNDSGGTGYMGACPPQGAKPHRYVFTLHALRVDKLPVPDDATPALVGFVSNANRLGQASFTLMHGR